MPKTPRRPKKSPKGDYATGYCRPPVHSQIPPGKVLNPWGRNGKPVEEPDAFEKTRRRLSRVTIEGETVMIPTDEAYWLRTMSAAMAGDKTAAKIIAQELGARRRLSPPALPPPTPEELAKREQLAAKLVDLLDEEADVNPLPSRRARVRRQDPPMADDSDEGSTPGSPWPNPYLVNDHASRGLIPSHR